MEVLYIPQLDDMDATGTTGASSRYRILKRVSENGMILLSDRAVTRIELSTSDAVKLVVPPLVKGAVRDFFVRIVITADEVPEIVFAAPSGETISFEDVDEEALTCEVGVNVFAFTETDEGAFIINRKQIDIDWEVTFDPVGGTLTKTTETYKLGAPYSTLPVPTLNGMVFQGWFTQAEGGVKVEADDRCKTGVTKLYAHWEVYVDTIGPSINPSDNLTFFTEGDAVWFIDADGNARSGATPDGGGTTLRTSVAGPGTLSFSYRVSSESGYDIFAFLCDRETVFEMSGEVAWTETSYSVGEGVHEFLFTYSKDGSIVNGQDCAWIKDVVWTPAGEEG